MRTAKLDVIVRQKDPADVYKRQGRGRIGPLPLELKEARFVGLLSLLMTARSHSFCQAFRGTSVNRTSTDSLTHCFAPGETIALPLRRDSPISVTQRIVAVELTLTRRKIS